MISLLVLISLNVLIFLISFLSLRFYDRKNDENTLPSLKWSYVVSFAIAVYMTYSGLKGGDIPVNVFNIITMILICLVPLSAAINGGYAVSIFLKIVFMKFRKKKPENKKGINQEEKTVRIIKSKRKK